jgi:hypothetical protein
MLSGPGLSGSPRSSHHWLGTGTRCGRRPTGLGGLILEPESSFQIRQIRLVVVRGQGTLLEFASRSLEASTYALSDAPCIIHSAKSDHVRREMRLHTLPTGPRSVKVVSGSLVLVGPTRSGSQVPVALAIGCCIDQDESRLFRIDSSRQGGSSVNRCPLNRPGYHADTSCSSLPIVPSTWRSSLRPGVSVIHHCNGKSVRLRQGKRRRR